VVADEAMGSAYSFAKTPLKAAHPPLAIASISHVDLAFGRDMVWGVCYSCARRLDVVHGGAWDKLNDLQVPEHPEHH
jgi:hypothetical protein